MARASSSATESTAAMNLRARGLTCKAVPSGITGLCSSSIEPEASPLVEPVKKSCPIQCRPGYHHDMSSPQTVLAHLLDGREELVREVARLTTAIAELDAVIDRVGGASTAGVAQSSGSLTPSSGATGPTGSGDEARRARRGTSRGASPSAGGRARKATSPTPRSSSAKRATQRRSSGGGQKSIRVHVLEMLASENRDFGLAEIIDRIHGAGITAHDDAVRSITIKLMKDGQVERVGRGQYRLAAGPRGAASADPDPTPDPQPASNDPAPDATAASLNLAAPWNSPQR